MDYSTAHNEIYDNCNDLERDCYLCLTNEREFYAFCKDLRLNLQKKYKAGVFDIEKAVEVYQVKIRHYIQLERVSSYYDCTVLAPERRTIARLILTSLAGEYELGNFE